MVGRTCFIQAFLGNSKDKEEKIEKSCLCGIKFPKKLEYQNTLTNIWEK